MKLGHEIINQNSPRQARVEPVSLPCPYLKYSLSSQHAVVFHPWVPDHPVPTPGTSLFVLSSERSPGYVGTFTLPPMESSTASTDKEWWSMLLHGVPIWELGTDWQWCQVQGLRSQTAGVRSQLTR